ncbi:MAG: SoxR reducing system RseC family protein [Deltaproteobacteria bacterium]|nr:SoxR reducing system RseC family protein [Deltaproteobacteria bacterium]MBW2137814.1 SoxR reducing system RseC family protein [Deltaproteobacteria bacterium]
METERGTVRNTEGHWAWVETERKGSCESCSHKGHCSMTGNGMNKMVVKAENDARAQVGDLVEIFLSTRTRLKGLFVIYIFPVIGLLSGAIAGNAFSRRFQWEADKGTVLFALSGLVVAFLMAKISEARMNAKRELTPIVSRVIRHGSP